MRDKYAMLGFRGARFHKEACNWVRKIIDVFLGRGEDEQHLRVIKNAYM